MRILFLYAQLTFCIFSFDTGYSQDAMNLQTQDSLIQIIQSQPSDTAKINRIHTILLDNIPKSDSLTNVFVQQATRLSKKQANPYFSLKTYRIHGTILSNKGDYETAITQFELLEQEAFLYKDTSFLATAKSEIARCYRNQGNYKKALEYLEAAETWYLLIHNEDKLCDLYTTIASIYRLQGQLDLTKKYLDKISKIAKSNRTKGQLNNQLGRYFRAIGQMDSARIAYERNLKIFTLLNKKNALSVTYNNLGNMAHIMGDYKGALDYYVQSKDIKESLGLTKGLAISYHNIGTIRSDLKDYPIAKQDFQKSLKLSEKIGFKALMVHNYNRLGELERFDSTYNIATEWHEKALDLAKSISFQTGINQAMLHLGEDYAKQEMTKQALDYFTEGLQIIETSGDQKLTSTCLIAIADLYLKAVSSNKKPTDINNLDLFQKLNINEQRVEQMLQRALKIANQLNYAEEKINVSESLHRFYSSTNNYKKDALLLGKFMVYKDSLFSSERANAIAALETKYEASEKEREILKLENDQKVATQEQKRLSTRTRIYLGIAVGLLTFLLIGFYLFYQLRKVKRTLEHQNVKLQEVNATKDIFFGIIAHDIRSPIVALDGVGEQMDYYLKKNKPDKLQRLASRVDATAKQLNSLLDNLLNWALLQQGVIPYHPKILKIQAIVDSTFAMFGNNATAKNIQLIASIPPNMEITADESAIYTILRNLVSNAIKFTPPKGIVSIAVYSEQDHVFIKVKDTGTGMSEQQVEQLFSLEKKSTQGTAGEKGTGLGLMLVKDLVSLNKGAILVNSNKNQGTVFTIKLPHAVHS